MPFVLSTGNEPLTEEELFTLTHPDGGFITVDEAMSRARAKLVADQAEALSDSAKEVILEEAIGSGDYGYCPDCNRGDCEECECGYCPDCDRGCCDDCESLSESRWDGYNEGYSDAVCRRDCESHGEPFEDASFRILYAHTLREAEIREQNEQRKRDEEIH